MNVDSEPLLSDAETDALLAAMREGGASSAGPSAEGIDLTSSEPRLREAFQPFDACGIEFAQSIRKMMLRHAGCPTEVRAEPVEIAPYSIIKDGTSAANAIVLATTADNGQAFMIVGPTLTSLIIDRRLGAPLKLDDSAKNGRSELSEVDRRVFLPFAEDIFGRLGLHLAKRSDLFRIADVVSPKSLPNLSQFEPLLQLSLIVEPVGGTPDRLTVALTATALTSIGLDKAEARPPASSPNDRVRIVGHIEATLVDVEAILGEIQSSVRHLLSLRNGDILRLDSVPSQPTQVRTEGVVILRGMPVVHHGNLAIEITDPR